MSAPTAEPCKAREHLESLVQHFLRELGRLAHEEAEVLKTRDQPLIMEIDRKIESLMGEKERALGALKQHRSEHGC
jgi:hypothetical protein